MTGSDLDDTDEYYDTSDDSDDEESVANIDDGLLDAVFDELPGKMKQKNIEKTMKTKQSVHIKTFNFNQIFLSGTGQTRPPAPTRPRPAVPTLPSSGTLTRHLIMFLFKKNHFYRMSNLSNLSSITRRWFLLLHYGR